MITIYHNPRCSKSRETLALVQQVAQKQQLSLCIVDYLKTPLNTAQLHTLQQQLGIPVGAMLRDNEDEYASLDLAKADESAVLDAIALHPKLLQRPIVVFQDLALIGRPPECVLALFKDAL